MHRPFGEARGQSYFDRMVDRAGGCVRATRVDRKCSDLRRTSANKTGRWALGCTPVGASAGPQHTGIPYQCFGRELDGRRCRAGIVPKDSKVTVLQPHYSTTVPRHNAKQAGVLLA